MEGALSRNQKLQVCEFSGELLLRILKRTLHDADLDLHFLSSKTQISYLTGYLDNEHAKTVVVESQYVDRHFLDDYANYHVRSFTDFGKTCTRIHFFDDEAILESCDERTNFYRGEFIEFLKGRSTKLSAQSLQKGYLGFTVIRPLSNAFIGRTCLRTYKDKATIDSKVSSGDNSRQRYYKSVKPVNVNLFGLDLKISSTLPFQEQDAAVAACASSALWSFFYGSKASNRRQIPSPSQITKIAEAKGVLGEQRLTGAHGLTPTLIRNAISAFDLEYVEYRIFESPQLLKEIIYGYQSKKDEPLLLCVDVCEQNSNGEFEFVDGHLITITGYELDMDTYNNPPISPGFEESRYRNVAASISKIYCHDDQLGPFARFELESVEKLAFLDSEYLNAGLVLKPIVKNKSSNPSSNINKYIYVPRILHLGVYHKIRNHFSSISKSSLLLNTALKGMIDLATQQKDTDLDKFWSKNKNISWDVAPGQLHYKRGKMLHNGINFLGEVYR